MCIEHAMHGIHTVCHLVKGALITCPAYSICMFFIQRCHAKKQKMRDRGFLETSSLENTSSLKKNLHATIREHNLNRHTGSGGGVLGTDTGIEDNYPELQCSEILVHYRCVNLNVSVHSPMP